MRRGLHRARAVAGVEHLAEQTLQVDRLGRRPHDAAPLAADARLDRPEQARAPPGGGEDREQEEARRRLPARAGDADHLELPGRLAEEHVRRGRHRRARVADDDLRHGQVERALDDERDRSALHRLRREVVAVDARARHGEEERARADRASVVGEIAHLDRKAPEHLHRLERCDEALQIHSGRECTRAGSGYLIRRSGEPPGTGGRTRRSARTPEPRRGRRRSARAARRSSRARGGAAARPAPSRRRSRRTRPGCSRSAPASGRCPSCRRRRSRESRRARPCPDPRRRPAASSAAELSTPRERIRRLFGFTGTWPATWSTRCGWIHSPPFAIAAYTDASWIAVTETPCPIGTVPIVEPDHDGSRPGLSRGKSIPVRRPNPKRAIHFFRPLSPR